MVLARWQRTIVDDAGNILPGASVTVKRDVSGSPLALIYSDRNGAVPMGNPFSSEADGLAAFHAVNGVYRIEVTSGLLSQTWRYVGVSTASESDTFLTGIGFLFSSATADADPGAGYFALNNATPASATQIYASTTDSADVDVTTWLDSFDDYGSSANRGVIALRSADGAVEFIGIVTGSVTTATGYRKITVTPVSATAAAAFITSLEFGLTFIPRGIDGVNGSNGEMTGPGAVVIAGQIAEFSSGTGTSVRGASVAEGSPTDPLIAGTIAGVRAAVPGHLMDAGQLRTAAAAVALSDAARVAVNWEGGINFSLTVTASRIIGNPASGIPGTFRTIMVQGNDATDRIITFDTQYLGEVPTIIDCDSTRWYLLTIFCQAQDHFVVSSKKAKGV